MKGITPIIAVILLLIISLAVVGMAYGFIVGLVTTTTSKVAIVSGVSSCSGGLATIFITNAGEANIVEGDVTVVVNKCVGDNTSACLTAGGFNKVGLNIQPGSSGNIKEVEGTSCGVGNRCTYEVIVGGITYTTLATC